ncbi:MULTISPECIES: ABC transporter ATP-binding protein [unclassified Actinotalea]|uniref:ABC transporter ATP-binding protein n=1 Tax=unclassified Actinotalea TaxID=2638618 RepID=UPI0015F4546E|nr:MULTISPECIES: ABC transporter ATP-binding protein [unclassified Actinotalea]
MPALHLNAVVKTFGTGTARVDALKGVTLTIGAGELVAVMGPSGCGKSTLLNVMGLVVPASAGTVTVEGEEVTRSSDRSLARLRNRTFGYVRQDFALIDEDTIRQNVEVPLLYGGRRLRRKLRSQMCAESVGAAQLDVPLRRTVRTLSGGERQRVAIARALVGSPRIVLADEPTGALDSATSKAVIDLLVSVAERGSSVVIATHDEQVAARCGRIVQMHDGSLVDIGE